MAIIKSYIGKYWDMISDVIRSEVPKAYRVAYLKKIEIEQELLKIDKLKKENPKQYTSKIEKKVEKLNKEADKLEKQMKGMDHERYSKFTPMLAYAKYMEKGIRDGFTVEDLKKMEQYAILGKEPKYFEKFDEKEPYAKEYYLRDSIDNNFGRMCYQEQLKISSALKRMGDKQVISADEVYNVTSVYRIRKNVTLRGTLETLKANMEDSITLLNDVDDNLHINSPSFRKMKNALLDLHKSISTDYKLEKNQEEILDIGDKIEKLHKASLDYVKEKGLGNKFTIVGKARMKLALILSQLTFDQLLSLPSRERMEKCVEENDLEKPAKEGEEPELDENGEEYDEEMSLDYFADILHPEK